MIKTHTLYSSWTLCAILFYAMNETDTHTHRKEKSKWIDCKCLRREHTLDCGISNKCNDNGNENEYAMI